MSVFKIAILSGLELIVFIFSTIKRELKSKSVTSLFLL
uniref:Uncharacterized protein n=1 Tax=Myoviridae sp. ctXho31 TaxID=2825122 RepID=A0A8S5TWS7_9CAUD|nr:MAG TPA: hypothetical protein [Myoviridae sp. ctXho31]